MDRVCPNCKSHYEAEDTLHLFCDNCRERAYRNEKIFHEWLRLTKQEIPFYSEFVSGIQLDVTPSADMYAALVGVAKKEYGKTVQFQSLARGVSEKEIRYEYARSFLEKAKQSNMYCSYCFKREHENRDRK